MFLGRDKCPSEHGIDLLSCAGFTFCDLNPETMKVTADASYMPCLTVLKEIKTCFQEKILSVLQNKLPT
uniref:A_deaminase domain-containing protein n=1 Tax=Globodera pallida TaxID=36090 RepID=A0A183BX50_GLOPA